MKINDILNLEPGELMKLDRPELAKIVSQMSSVANKRITRLKSSGVQSQALTNVERGGGLFGVKGKSLNQIRSEYKRARGFLQSKSSTVKGARKVNKQVEQQIGGELTPSQFKEFWKAYNRLEELEPNFLRIYGSEQMQKFLRNELVENNASVDELLQSGLEEIQRQYEETTESMFDDLGEFFEI